MPRINKPLKVKKVKVTKTKPKRNKKLKKNPSVLVKKSTTKRKNAHQYYVCMAQCCQGKISPKKITQIAHECKTNALAINAKMSAQKASAVKKIKAGYQQLGKGLDEFIKSK
jgi:hypothetical protein